MPDALTHPSTPEQLRLLRRSDLIDDAGLQRGLELLAATPPPEQWRRFLSVVLLALGSALALSGIVFFFAYNWDDIGRFAKLGMLQGGVVVTFLAAWRLGLEALSGKVALMAASVLVGVTMAVYGQTYQTGADAWELFSTWSLLILPWVLVARFPALWALAIVLANTTVILWTQQVLVPKSFWETLLVVLPLAAANAGGWLIWELGGVRKPWMASRWLPRLLACWVLFMLVSATSVWIFDGGSGGVVALLTLIGACAAMLFIQPGGRRDLFLPTAALAAGMWVLDAALIRLLFDGLDAELLGWMVMSVVFLAEAAISVAWLLKLRAQEVTR